MPIRKELRRFYGAAWRQTRRRILERAGNRCEQCGKPDRQMVWAAYDGTGRWEEHVQWVDERGITRFYRWWNPDKTPADEPESARIIVVVLTVAHLNHTPGDDRDENLKALCQWCHLHYDRLHHKRTRSIRKDRNRPLLAKLEQSL